MEYRDVFPFWDQFVAKGKEIPPESIRPVVLDSWKRSRAFGADPNRICAGRVSDEELSRRLERRADLHEVARPYLQNLYRILAGTASLISLSDEDSVILDLETDDSIRVTKNFPHPGTIHSEDTIGTSGTGTALMMDQPVQIQGAEHWMAKNHCWSCNSVPVHHSGKIIGCLTLSCPAERAHEHSLGLVVAAVKAIERELDLTATLKEKQSLVKQQNAILELVDTGIALIDREGRILCTNKMLNDIFERKDGCVGQQIDELIPTDIDFVGLIARDVSLNDREISLRLANTHTHLRISTALIKDGGSAESMVIRVRESSDVLRLVNRVAGSKATYTFQDILGKSPALLQCIKLAQNASRSSANVLILGESGTGKELVRAGSPQSQPSAHGAFRGHQLRRPLPRADPERALRLRGGRIHGRQERETRGVFELADGGTIFLDEIGELPLEAQSNLLRVLQTGRSIASGPSTPSRSTSASWWPPTRTSTARSKRRRSATTFSTGSTSSPSASLP